MPAGLMNRSHIHAGLSNVHRFHNHIQTCELFFNFFPPPPLSPPMQTNALMCLLRLQCVTQATVYVSLLLYHFDDVFGELPR